VISDNISKISTETIHIVIPVHNRKAYTLDCLGSLMAQTVAGFNIVVVDDGSTDGTADAVRAEFPSVTILEGDGNLWWSASMNLGIKYALGAGAEYILSLNNDLEVAPDYIEKMLAWAVRKPDALFGSYYFNIQTRKPHHGGSRFDWRTCRTVHLLDILPDEERKGVHEVTHFPGRGLWVPVTVFSKIGLFDAKWLPQYGADEDFTLRARKKGFKVYCNYDAILYGHVESRGSAQYRNTFSVRNYFQHLFGIKGGANLKNLTVICLRHCPKRYLLTAWSYGLIQRCGGYLWDWIKHQSTNRKDANTKV